MARGHRDLTNCYIDAAGAFAIADHARRIDNAHFIVSSFSISRENINNDGAFLHSISRETENPKSRFGTMLSRSRLTGLFENQIGE